jgi:uncharacterized protein (TIGR00369 family)
VTVLVPDLETMLAHWAERARPHPEGATLPPHHERCLGCGPDNHSGHRILVHRRGDRVSADHLFDDRHVGAPGVVHGGAVATVLDDLFGFLPYLLGTPAVTRQLTVDYLSPVLAGVTYKMEARVTSREDRKFFASATLANPDERTVATSSAVFVMVGFEHFARHAGAPAGSPTPSAADQHTGTGPGGGVGQLRE